ncbi:MAG: leucine-rich repeat protein, partial [Muribaculaceae bacterium]|nr:leucine-rich repeat protein [Muribaculaceae bacterium]
MKKNVLLALAAALTALLSQAEINNEAGNLSQQVTDHTITSLTVTGELDARDFKFIADSLLYLETVDLSQATIVAYYNDEPLFGTKQDYAAGYLPATTFFGKPIASIVLPQAIENIGEAAFASCQNLTNIEFPPTLTTIGDYAFSASGLTQVTLPESITTLGICVFSHCSNLTQATIGTTTTGNGTFLADTLLSQVNMAAAVRFIGDNAFTGCKALNAIEIEQPSQLSAIGVKAFMESGLQELNLSELDSIGAFAFAKSAIGAANYPAAITAVEPGTFFYAPQLTTFDAAVTQIGDYAFAGSNNLAAMPLPQGVETIGDYAFYNMDNITQFTVPQSVTYIGSYAMAGMTALESIEGEPTIVPQLGDNVWAGVDQAHVTLFVDQSVVEDYKAAFQWQKFLVKSHFLLGDVNADGIVNVADITTMVNHVLDRYVPIFIFEAGDLDGDGLITITDVTLLSTLILSSNYSPVAHFMPITTSDITLTDITAQNQSLTTELTLSNTQQYTALQADITMPQGVTINDITTGQRASKHQLD